VMITSLPVGLTFVITSTLSPNSVCPLMRYFSSAVSLSLCRSTIFPVKYTRFNIVNGKVIVIHLFFGVKGHYILLLADFLPHQFDDSFKHMSFCASCCSFQSTPLSDNVVG